MSKYAANNTGKTLYGKNDGTDYYSITRRVQQIPLVNLSASIGLNQWNKEIPSSSSSSRLSNKLVVTNSYNNNNNNNNNLYWGKPSSAFGIRRDEKIVIANTNDRSTDNGISITPSTSNVDQRNNNENINNNNEEISSSKKQVRFADEIAQYSDGISNNTKSLAIGLRGVQGILPSSSLKGSIRASSASMATRPTRPSLSDQLAAIGAKAEALTLDIRQKNGMNSAPPINNNSNNNNANQSMQQTVPQEGLLFTVPAKQFSVGTLSCRYPSPISFYKDRCEYSFAHPFKNMEVQMVMHYKDMRNVSITGQSFRFRIPKRMAIFPTDYDPSNITNNICVDFVSGLAVSLIREKVVPSISICTSSITGKVQKVNAYV